MAMILNVACSLNLLVILLLNGLFGRAWVIALDRGDPTHNAVLWWALIAGVAIELYIVIRDAFERHVAIAVLGETISIVATLSGTAGLLLQLVENGARLSGAPIWVNIIFWGNISFWSLGTVMKGLLFFSAVLCSGGGRQ